MEQSVTSEESSSTTTPPQTIKMGEQESQNDKTEVEDEMERVVPCKTGTILSEDDSSPKDFFLSSTGPEFLEDQGRMHNFTDLDLICCDGYIQVHRCLLMGASKFFRDLLIDKDVLNSCAISLPDITVHHLRQVLRIIYTGKTIIDGNHDQFEIMDTMNMLGFPTAELECRGVRIKDDTDQVPVLRLFHIPDDGTCVEEDCAGNDELEQGDGDIEMECEKIFNDENVSKKIKAVLEEEGTRDGSESLTDPVDQKSDFEEGPLIFPTGRNVDEDDHDHLQQITSTTGDLLAMNDVAAENLLSSQNGKEIHSKSNKYDLKENSQHKKTVDNSSSDNDALSKDKNHGTNTENGNAELDPSTDLNNSNASNASVQSANSDDKDDDLNFEEACNDLQKQVAKPPMSDINGSGHEVMELRKRKSNDGDTTEVKDSTEESSKADVRATRSKTKAKKKRPPPKKVTRRMNLRSAGSNASNKDEDKLRNGGSNASNKDEDKLRNEGHNASNKDEDKLRSGGSNANSKDENGEESKSNANQNDEESAKSPRVVEKRPREKSPDRESISSVKSRKSDSSSSQQQRRLSSSSNNTEGSTSSSGRVLVGIRDFNGVMYNIYGLMDPVKGCQSGKTIAIVASKDKTKPSG